MPRSAGTCPQRHRPPGFAYNRRCQFPSAIVQVTLLIPDLLPPPGAESIAGGQAPLLRRLLARGNTTRFAPIATEHWLCQAFEVEARGDWPAAPLTALLDGLPAESGQWLRADPIHLQLHRDRMAVLAAPALQLSQDEADALCATLNAHFRDDALRIEAPRPSRWYLSSPEGLGQTPPPSSVAGRALPRTALPAPWHRRLTEIQMLLHEHPVNRAREGRGTPAVNSLLLWGHGHRPAVPGRHYGQVWSGDALAIALAVQSGAESADTPASAAAWLENSAQHPAQGHHLVHIEDAHLAARYGGPEAWLAALERLERDWLAPLWSRLGRGINAIDLVLPGDAECLRVRATPAHRLRFWRRDSWPASASPQ